MDKASLAPTEAQPNPPERIPDYCLRGLGIFEVARDQILASYQGGGRWLVPSGSERGHRYEVRTGTRPERDRCECIGFEHHKHCSHLVAAHRARQTSAVCDGCGTRCWNREMVRVHENEQYFPGDLLCKPCADQAGVEW